MNNIRESQAIPGFHSVAFFREVKERIAAETNGMTFEELKRYIAERASRGSRKKFERAPSKVSKRKTDVDDTL